MKTIYSTHTTTIPYTTYTTTMTEQYRCEMILRRMDISIIEQYLRKVKLNRINKLNQ